METWKPAPRFEGRYEVSSEGRVRNCRTGVILSPYMRGGYRCVTLRHGASGHSSLVHNLVLEAFKGPRPAGHQGAHLDGDRERNALANLDWVTQSENEAHKRGHGRDSRGERSPHSRLTNAQAEIVREIAAAGVTRRKLAHLLNMAESSIGRIVDRSRYP